MSSVIQPGAMDRAFVVEKAGMFHSIIAIWPGVYQLKYTGGFPENDREAMTVSLEKWLMIHHFWTTHPEAVELDGIGTDTCGLCMRHWYWNDLNPMLSCGECPIARAGHPLCSDTPYDYYLEVYRNDDGDIAAAAHEEYMFLLQMSLDMGL